MAAVQAQYASQPGTFVNGGVSRTVVMERYAVASPRTVAVPRTQIEARTVVVPRSFTYGEVQNHTVPHTVTTQELHVGLKDDKVTVPRTVFDDSTTTVQVPRTGLRDSQILVPKMILVKQNIKVPYSYLENQEVPIKVPRVVPQELPIKVPFQYAVPRQHVVHETRTTIVPRTQVYQEQHVQYQPRTVIDTAVVQDTKIIERPRVYEQEAPKVFQTIIPGHARSYYGPSRVAGLTYGGYGGYPTAVSGRSVVSGAGVPAHYGTGFSGFW